MANFENLYCHAARKLMEYDEKGAISPITFFFKEDKNMSKATSVTPSTPSLQVPHDKIAMRAYEKWCKRGRPKGSSEKQDWLEAEAELRMELSRSASSPMPQAASRR
jgi:hypothetical protein